MYIEKFWRSRRLWYEKSNDIKFISSKENGISFIKNSIKDVEKSIKKGNISDIIYLNNLYNALSNISK